MIMCAACSMIGGWRCGKSRRRPTVRYVLTLSFLLQDYVPPCVFDKKRDLVFSSSSSFFFFEGWQFANTSNRSSR